MKKIALVIATGLFAATAAQAQDFGGSITPEVGAGIAAGTVGVGLIALNNGDSDNSTGTTE